ncbi:hemolysin [Luteibacter rhizovicinus DSM 16549]|uniref:Hemolysin n=1 Tax=Luteibacter rhizovicinus DSM 16549 TaxID=1440763 RepID=A0A0G9HIY6_9GAMM|nr:hemolysin family protein [Luteibacter rhizovicinus]APG04495.1 hemolysin [Luteibacter rhizovicinus DSM 16549]KLD67627.1 hemolysin [Luteibacter rhizovicinus DSM 16549]KLD75946.1 hemolysin [Xanthomonas hyacinthi DSM 19077]
MLPDILLVLFLSLGNAFFALSEMSVVASRKSRLKQMARTSRRSAAALRLAESPERFLSTVQVGMTLIILVTGAVAGDTLGEQFTALIHRGEPAWLEPYAKIVGWLLGFLLMSLVQIVIGELVPKRAALTAPERIASQIAMPMLVISRITLPMVWLLNHLSSGILHVLRLRRGDASAATEEEIRLLVAESAEQGILDLDERNMVNRVLRLGDRTVGSVMTPRMKIAWLDTNASQEDNLEVLRETPFSRYPVYRGDESEVVGTVEVKSLFGSLQRGEVDLFKHISRPLFVPATARALDLLESFRDADTQLALAVDEYGDIEGLVTLNDLLSAVVGATAPSTDDTTHDGPIVRREDGSWLVDGALPADDLRELLQLDRLPNEEEHDFRTAAGMVTTNFGHIPRAGESFVWQGIRFEVLDMDGARIDKLLVSMAGESEAVAEDGA